MSNDQPPPSSREKHAPPPPASVRDRQVPSAAPSSSGFSGPSSFSAGPASEPKVYEIEPTSEQARKSPPQPSRPRPSTPPTGGFPAWLTFPLLVLALLAIPAIAWLAFSGDGSKRSSRTSTRLEHGDLADDEEDEDEVDDEAPPPKKAPDHEEPAHEEEVAVDQVGIHGIVVQGEQVVPSVMIRCSKPGEDERILPSNMNGQFAFPDEADGCTAIAESPRYGRSRPTILKKGAENRIEMPGQGSVAGTVVDERGLTVTKFLVDLDHAVLSDGSFLPGGSQRSVDDPEGKFSLERLAAGTWTLLVSAAGRPATKVEVLVEADKTTENVRVRLERGATLLGSVIDRTTKRPIGGATITLDEGERVSAIQPATTSPGGDFRLEGIPTGSFSIEVQHPDYLARIMSGLDAKGQRQLRVTVDLAPGGDAGGRLEMSGIGASLSADAQRRVVVRSVREGGPAEKAGMQAEDVILAIDGKTVEGFDVQACVQLLRGPPGTDVAVTVSRDGNPIGMTILRETMVQ